MTERTDYVAQYSLAGYSIFPLNGKTPTVKEWQKTPPNTNLNQSKMTRNYGVVLPDEILVIDVDVKNGALGKESFVKLTADLNLKTGWEMETYVVKTGTGGYHIYLSKPTALKIKKNTKQYPGIDFLSSGCFVVGAGSVHPDTKVEYTVVFGTPGGVRPAPTNLEPLIQKVEVLSPDVEPGFIDNDPLTLERFREIIKGMPDVSQGNRTNSTYIVACRGRDLGLTQEKCCEVLLEHYNPKITPALTANEMNKVVKDAYTYAQGKAGNANPSAIFQTVSTVKDDDDLGIVGYDMTAKKVVKPTLNNAVNYLRTTPGLEKLFRYNTFTENIEIDASAPWFSQRGLRSANVSDEDVILLKFLLSRTYKVEFSQDLLMEAIVVRAFRQHYHPVRNYLNSLVWDKKPRLDTWLSRYGGAADTVYTRAVGRKTLCAAVRRVFQPGCKHDFVLVMEGPQGIGKSTMCRILGRMWSGDMNLDPHQKDSVQMMLGKWIIELSEMVALKWAEASALKSFITRELDTVRLAYARHVKDFPRQSIFIGTCNPEHIGYLSDVTGNRRFWIVHLPKAVDMVGLENDCNQLWAETVQCYKNEVPYLTGEAAVLHGYEAQARMPQDPMKQDVGKFLAENPDIDKLELTELIHHMGIPSKNATKYDQNRLAQALIELKWTKEVDFSNGVVQITYNRPNAEKITRLIEDL